MVIDRHDEMEAAHDALLQELAEQKLLVERLTKRVLSKDVEQAKERQHWRREKRELQNSVATLKSELRKTNRRAA